MEYTSLNTQFWNKAASSIHINEGGLNPLKRGGEELQQGKGKKKKQITKKRVAAEVKADWSEP